MNTNTFNPQRQIAIIWDISDVQLLRPDLTDEQALSVLEKVKDKHDADIGVSWTTIDIWADILFPLGRDDEEEKSTVAENDDDNDEKPTDEEKPTVEENGLGNSSSGSSSPRHSSSKNGNSCDGTTTKEIYRVEVGVLLESNHPEFKHYNHVYTRDFGFCDLHTTHFPTFAEARKWGDEYITNGADKTYAVIAKDIADDNTESSLIDALFDGLESSDSSWNFGYTEDDILYFAYKNNTDFIIRIDKSVTIVEIDKSATIMESDI